MTLLNESDEVSTPSSPLSILDRNLSVLATSDPSDSPLSFPTSSPSLTLSNCTSPSPGSPPRYNFYAMLLVLLIFCVVFGNVLVCLAVSRERALQTTTNYLIVSLAVSDLLLATLVMPWGVYLEVKTPNYIWKSIQNDDMTAQILTHRHLSYFSHQTHKLVYMCMILGFKKIDFYICSWSATWFLNPQCWSGF